MFSAPSCCAANSPQTELGVYYYSMTSQIVRSSIFGIAMLLAFTFIPAGTFNYWQGWAYVATWIIVGSAYTAYVAKHDPALLKRRAEAGISHEKESAQKVIVFSLFAAFFLLAV